MEAVRCIVAGLDSKTICRVTRVSGQSAVVAVLRGFRGVFVGVCVGGGARAAAEGRSVGDAVEECLLEASFSVITDALQERSASTSLINASITCLDTGNARLFCKDKAFVTTPGLGVTLYRPVWPVLGQLPTRKPQREQEHQRCHWLAPYTTGHVSRDALGVSGSS